MVLRFPFKKLYSIIIGINFSRFLQGYDRSFKLCKSQCGKIVSSIEKTEENLKTGTKAKIDASNQWGN